MTFNDEHAVEQVASLPAMKTAVRSGTDLTELWPLTTAERMDNDAKYAENLQVRLTLTMARVLVGTTEVTLPDAEFVYEVAPRKSSTRFSLPMTPMSSSIRTQIRMISVFCSRPPRR